MPRPTRKAPKADPVKALEETAKRGATSSWRGTLHPNRKDGATGRWDGTGQLERGYNVVDNTEPVTNASANKITSGPMPMDERRGAVPGGPKRGRR